MWFSAFRKTPRLTCSNNVWLLPLYFSRLSPFAPSADFFLLPSSVLSTKSKKLVPLAFIQLLVCVFVAVNKNITRSYISNLEMSCCPTSLGYSRSQLCWSEIEIFLLSGYSVPLCNCDLKRNCKYTVKSHEVCLCNNNTLFYHFLLDQAEFKEKITPYSTKVKKQDRAMGSWTDREDNITFPILLQVASPNKF